MKSDVLKILEEHRGEAISGSKISQWLGITRSAVWKDVSTLKKQGYRIEGVTNKGYCLITENDIISEFRIQKYLHTSRLGRQIEVHEELDSTNNLAKEYAANGTKEGLLVVAKQQSNGKGRLGKHFYSPQESGIYMSVVLRPTFPAQESVFITVCAAVAVCRAIEQVSGIQTQIKWVNDIYYNGKKLCGILTEASLEVESGGFTSVILGIGVNICPPQNGYPSEIEQIATSLLECNPSKTFFKNQLIAEILNQFEQSYVSFDKEKFLEEYKSRSCIIGENIEIIQNGKISYAKAIGIDDNAMLLAKKSNGEIITLHSGEVSIRRKL